MNHIKRTLKIIGFNIFFLILLLFIIEALVRLVFPDLIICGFNRRYLIENKYKTSFGLKPGITGVLFEKKVLTDDFGFRVDNLAKTVSKPKIRILFLGDSVSFGLGVEAQDSFPFILQRDIPGCLVINSSVPGYGIHDYYNVLEYLSQKMDFDGIIVCVCLDDFSTAPQSFIRNYFEDRNRYAKLALSPFQRFLIWFNNSVIDFNSVLREHSKAYMLIRDKVMNSPKVIFEAQDLTYSMPQINEIILNSMRQLNYLASKEGKWILFVVFPFEYQFDKDAGDEVLKPQKIINAVAARSSLPVIDLYHYFKVSLSNSNMRSTSLYCDAMHFSKNGNQVIARVIYSELSRRGFLKKQISEVVQSTRK